MSGRAADGRTRNQIACSQPCSSRTSSARLTERSSWAIVPGASCSSATTHSYAVSWSDFAVARSTRRETASLPRSTDPRERSGVHVRLSTVFVSLAWRCERACIRESAKLPTESRRYRRPHGRSGRRPRRSRGGRRVEYGQGPRRRIGHRVRRSRSPRAKGNPRRLAPVRGRTALSHDSRTIFFTAQALHFGFYPRAQGPVP